MPAPTVNQVRQCAKCGSICDMMDTVCPRCRGFGSLHDRFECSRCERILDEPFCKFCNEAMGIHEGAPPVSGLHSRDDSASVPDITDSRRTMPDVADPYGVPPWVAGAVGGIIVGGLVGVAGGYFFNINPWIGGLVSIIPGAILGALMGGNNPTGHKGRR